MKVLLVCPFINSNAVSESRNNFVFAKEISNRAETTILTFYHPHWPKPSLQGIDARFIEWPDYTMFQRLPRFNAVAKPGYFLFRHKASKWLQEALRKGEKFDVIHQISPPALRSPAINLGSYRGPFVLGPLSGSVPRPRSFSREFRDEPLFMKMRLLDAIRLRIDPWIRRGIERADIVLGSAPYVRTRLRNFAVKRFEVFSRICIDKMPDEVSKPPHNSEHLRLLFVGRIVRWKGARDAIRAIATLGDLPNVTLDIVGDGDDLPACMNEVNQLDLSTRVKFHGWCDRMTVSRMMVDSHVFVFPSITEPAGGVVVEAMSHGLPVIAIDAGGPGFYVTEQCGVKVPASNPDQVARDLAFAIRSLATNPNLVESMGRKSVERIKDVALLPTVFDRLIDLYKEAKSERQ
ncbi:MAG: glycosyltransferase family 4 protein [Pirellula sp.]